MFQVTNSDNNLKNYHFPTKSCVTYSYLLIIISYLYVYYTIIYTNKFNYFKTLFVSTPQRTSVCIYTGAKFWRPEAELY